MFEIILPFLGIALLLSGTVAGCAVLLMVAVQCWSLCVETYREMKEDRI